MVVLEQNDGVGGVWFTDANDFSRVNTSEPGYRVRDQDGPSNFLHTPKSMIMSDLTRIATTDLAGCICLRTSVCSIKRAEEADDGDDPKYGKYIVAFEASEAGSKHAGCQHILSNQVVVCVNRRLGRVRQVTFTGEDMFQGIIRYGVGNQIKNVDFTGKRVLVIGGGAFATENARTAIEKGAAQVVVLSRRRGTVMPHVFDYLFFIRPFDGTFRQDAKGAAIMFSELQKAYASHGATPPECWEEGRLIPTGQAGAVSDIWMVAHHFGLLSTRQAARNLCSD